MKHLLLSCLPLLPLLLPAQTNRISGRVVQKSTGAAIPNASIFISGSSIGTTSDTAGKFELNGIMPGNFQLVVSSIGYTTIVYPFSTEKLPLTLNLQMIQKAQELVEVTVEPLDPDGWRHWGNFFLEQFIGYSEAGKQCHITNTNALRFRYDQKEGELTVMADEPLVIENEYLGYTIKYQLEEFTYNQRNRTIFYVGYPYFVDNMAKRKRIPNRIAERRMATWNGSMSHFMQALYNNRLMQEGFEVRRLVVRPNEEKERVKKYMVSESRRNIVSGGKTVMRLGVTRPADTMTYYRNVMQQPDQLKNIGASLLNADSLLLPGEDSTRRLVFSDFLQVIYKKALEEMDYLYYTRQSRKARNPVSEMLMHDPAGLNIYPNGYYYPPQAIFSLEYWAWSEKIAHLLPVGYVPPGKKN